MIASFPGTWEWGYSGEGDGTEQGKEQNRESNTYNDKSNIFVSINCSRLYLLININLVAHNTEHKNAHTLKVLAAALSCVSVG